MGRNYPQLKRQAVRRKASRKRNRARAIRAPKDKALASYAKQAKNLQMELDAIEIRIRAERRLGELIEAQKETVGLNRGTAGAGRPRLGGVKVTPPKDDRPTLAAAGIDKDR